MSPEKAVHSVGNSQTLFSNLTFLTDKICLPSESAWENRMRDARRSYLGNRTLQSLDRQNLRKMMKKIGFNKPGSAFLLLWMGQTCALIGASLMEFAIGVWIFQNTGSVLGFSAVILSAVLPAVITLPLAGTVSDRFNRGAIILISALLAAAMMIVLAKKIWAEALKVFHIYVFSACLAIAGSFRMPAYKAYVSNILDKKEYLQGSGMMEISNSIVNIFSPFAAGAIMYYFALSGIVFINIAFFILGSFFVGVSIIINRNNKIKENAGDNEKISLFHFLEFFARYPILYLFLIYAATLGALVAFASSMMIPLVLSTLSERELGIILTSGGLGGLAGALFLTLYKNNNAFVKKIILSDIILSLCILVAGASNQLYFYCAAAFCALFSASLAEGCMQAFWMRKCPLQYRGSIFATVDVLSLGAGACAVLFGGMIVDTFLTPALLPGGAWDNVWIATWFGVGEGRGLAFLFMVVGLSGFVISTIAFFVPRFGQLDNIIPDADSV